MPVYKLRRNCKICGKNFLINHPRHIYCDTNCRKEQLKIWDKKRAKTKNFKIKIKSWKKKKELLLKLGGKCKTCSIDDLRVLEFAHKNSEEKHPRLKKREKMHLMTRWKIIEKEIKQNRVELKCANCHRIETHEEFWNNEIIK